MLTSVSIENSNFQLQPKFFLPYDNERLTVFVGYFLRFSAIQYIFFSFENFHIGFTYQRLHLHRHTVAKSTIKALIHYFSRFTFFLLTDR